MENRTINIEVVAEVAAALKDIKEDMVFVGGAVVSLYTDDPAADEIRPTQDIDLTLNIINLHHWEAVQEKLGILGFYPDPFGHAICSYKYKDIPVDIMAAEDGPLGPANRWYKIGFENLWTAKAKDQKIKILSAPCYLATKFEAFNDRGTDYRTSHDIEDIITVLDNRINIVDEIKLDNDTIRAFIIQELKTIIGKGILQEILMSHIHPLVISERLPIINEKITQILTLNGV
ncbi:nucleotidyl transferase AbiEii/AbiGii toxin family protein [Flagellimonas lutimaris]|uniref:nucleotidyl transferase AbiEii/AbiGii toxin family protein n=1 Tax=Flagellimonas lutimaris TaxID=475082 RepID=UPI0039C4AFC1